MACVRRRRGKWVADYRDHTGKRREKAASPLFAGTGSKTVTDGVGKDADVAQLVDSRAPPAGVEPTTYRLGGGRSIH